MTIGLVGRKVGMTRIFTEDGTTLPVTVLDVSDNRITQIKTPEKDGYAAVQVAFGKRRASRVKKPLAGHLAKATVEAGHLLKEFRADAKDLANLKVGAKIGVELFKVGQKVDVQGVTIGKGFAGVIKRHHFSSNRATHGNSISHNKPGSTGQNQSPGRVFPGKRMAGHLGDAKRTVSNLTVVRVDAERQLLLVKGAVPGSSGRDVPDYLARLAKEVDRRMREVAEATGTADTLKVAILAALNIADDNLRARTASPSAWDEAAVGRMTRLLEEILDETGARSEAGDAGRAE